MLVKHTPAIWVCMKIGYIPNEIAIFRRDHDQQNHWVQWGTNHFQTNGEPVEPWKHQGTSIGSFVETPEAGANMENIAAVLGDFIGGITLTGSDLEPGLKNINLDPAVRDPQKPWRISIYNTHIHIYIYIYIYIYI